MHLHVRTMVEAAMISLLQFLLLEGAGNLGECPNYRLPFIG